MNINLKHRLLAVAHPIFFFTSISLGFLKMLLIISLSGSKKLIIIVLELKELIHFTS